VRLIERGSRSLRLTDEGRALHERADGLLSEIAEAEEAAALGASTPRGRLRVSADIVLAHVALGRIGARFALAYPEVQLEIVAEDRVVDLVEEAYDLVIRINPSPDERLVGRCFLNDERVIVATPDVPKPCPTTEGEDLIVKSVLLGTRPAPAVWRCAPQRKRTSCSNQSRCYAFRRCCWYATLSWPEPARLCCQRFSLSTTSRRVGLHVGEPMPVRRWKSGRSKARAASSAPRSALSWTS